MATRADAARTQMPPAPRPALSIVIPCLNEAQDIAGTLDALAPLRIAGAEVVVVDGHSSDGSAEIARPRADQVLSAPRSRALQMNAGAAAAHGQVLLFLHADTRLPAGAAESIAVALRSGTGSWGRFDVAIDAPQAVFRLIAALMNLRSRRSGIATGDQAIFATREAFEAVGGYPEQPLMEDIELSARLLRIGRPLCLRDRVTTSARRWQRHGVWRTIVLMWRLRLLYRLGVRPERLARSYR